MNDEPEDAANPSDRAPGERARASLRTYVVGLALAAALTVASFLTVGTPLVYGPAIPAALVVLAVAQMGVHLVFFLHVTTGPDNTNNVLALAFGVLIVFLVIAGSLWIMANLNAHMPSMTEMLNMQR